jgi:hypothetical protein
VARTDFVAAVRRAAVFAAFALVACRPAVPADARFAATVALVFAALLRPVACFAVTVLRVLVGRVAGTFLTVFLSTVLAAAFFAGARLAVALRAVNASTVVGARFGARLAGACLGTAFFAGAAFFATAFRAGVFFTGTFLAAARR